MDELNFKIWLSSKGVKSKVISDIVSRLKRLERELGSCDIDEEYRNNECKHLFSALLNNGNNEVMNSFQPVNLPIGKQHMSTFRYALKKYVNFIRQKST